MPIKQRPANTQRARNTNIAAKQRNDRSYHIVHIFERISRVNFPVFTCSSPSKQLILHHLLLKVIIKASLCFFSSWHSKALLELILFVSVSTVPAKVLPKSKTSWTFMDNPYKVKTEEMTHIAFSKMQIIIHNVSPCLTCHYFFALLLDHLQGAHVWAAGLVHNSRSGSLCLAASVVMIVLFFLSKQLQLLLNVF